MDDVNSQFENELFRNLKKLIDPETRSKVMNVSKVDHA